MSDLRHFIGTATRMSTTVPAIILVRYNGGDGFPYITTEFAMGADGEWERGREWLRRTPEEVEALGYKPVSQYNLPSPKAVAQAMGLDYGKTLAALREATERECERVAAWKVERVADAQVAQ